MLSLMIHTTKELNVGDIFQLHTNTNTTRVFCHNIVLARHKTGLSVLRIDANAVPVKRFLKFSGFERTSWKVKTDVAINFRTI